MLAAVNLRRWGGRLRALALAFLMLGACARPQTSAPVTTGGVATTSAPVPTAEPQVRGGAGGSSAVGGSSAGRTSTGRTSTARPQVVDSPTDDGRTGGNAYWYLNAATPALDIEIDAVPGMAPSSKSVDLLRERLAAVADKPGGIDVLPVETISGSSHQTWTDDEISQTERAHRRTHNSLGRASIYLLFVDGHSEHEGAIGMALDSSSAVIFEQSVRDAASALITAQEIERSVMIHEVGHLLALVNLTYRSPRDHEDPNHPGHSNDPKSVMYWAIDNIGVATLLEGQTSPPTTFDADDLADLADLRAGRLGSH
jgi:hypothetical protein